MAPLGASHVLGVGSGTDALHLAIRACNIGPGDEVITVSHTAVATVAAIEMAGATPVLVDVDPEYYTMNPSQFAAAITPRTRAVIPVHLYGQPADLEAILNIAREASLRVIEDACQAHGATCDGRRVGTIGDVGCFSFYPTKNLGAVGDGGALVTNDPQIVAQARLLHQYGWQERFVSEVSGWNSRLDEIQAAILRANLRQLESCNSRRQEIAERYSAALATHVRELPRIRSGCQHVFHQFVIRHTDRDRLMAELSSHGIRAGIHYPVPVHLQPAYRNRIATSGDLTHTESAASQILSLPIYPELADADIDHVADTLQQLLEGAS